MSNRLWFSTIEYRPDPSLPDEGRISLGVIAEAEISTSWIVAVQARAFLSEDELSRLDGVGKELFREPLRLIAREVEAVLGQAKQPRDVLRLLCAREVWSFRFEGPRKLGSVGSEASLMKRLDRLYGENVGRAVTRPARRKPVSPSPAPPWAEPVREWRVPLGAHA